MMKTNILSEFKTNLKNIQTYRFEHISSMYHHLFSLLTDEELSEILETWKDEYNKDKEDWFYYFHKSIRQTDFFNNIRAYRVIDKLTDDQRTRRQFLLHKRMDQLKEHDTDEEFIALRQTEEWKNDLKELQKLNSILYTEDEFSIAGHLDMLLWNTIHLDTENYLKNIFERTFKIVS